MPSMSGPLSVSSIFRSLAAAPHDGHDRHQAARQLASLDPKRFLSNLQVAATSRSPQALSALTADMRELEDIFHKLSKAGHDVSAAQRDFQVLKQFIAQLTMSSKDQQQQPRPYPIPAPSNQAHHRSNSFPPTSSRAHPDVLPPHPYHEPHLQSSSGSVSQQHYSHSYRSSSSSSPSSKTQYETSQQLQGFAQGGSSSASSHRSSSSSSRSSSQSSHYSQAAAPAIPPEILSPVPNRLVKPRRMSAPAVASVKEVKRVHFARHATVYMFSTDVRGTYRVTNNETNAPFPPARPSCVPRVDGSHTSESRPRF